MSPKYRVIAVDLPGFGESEALADLQNYETLSQAIANFLSNLKISTTNFVGVSFGAVVGLYLANRHRKKISSLILNSPATKVYPDINLTQKIILKTLNLTPSLRNYFCGFLLNHFNLAVRILYINNPPKAKNAVLEKIFLANKNVNPETFYRTMNTMLFDNIDLKISQPTLIFTGPSTQDAFVPQSKILAERLGAKYQVVTNATHTFVIDQPKEFAQVILDFLATKN